jgi:hypothetical protein
VKRKTNDIDRGEREASFLHDNELVGCIYFYHDHRNRKEAKYESYMASLSRRKSPRRRICAAVSMSTNEADERILAAVLGSWPVPPICRNLVVGYIPWDPVDGFQELPRAVHRPVSWLTVLTIFEYCMSLVFFGFIGMWMYMNPLLALK